MLVERLKSEYGYPDECIQTNPRWSILTSTLGSGEYAVDIAVFNDSQRRDDNLWIIGDCQVPRRHDGERKIKILLANSGARIGVWFNGEDHSYIVKRIVANRVVVKYLPDFPRYGQGIKDIGRFKRRDLIMPRDLKSVFQELRNHILGQETNIHDRELAEEIINVLICKIHDELNTPPDQNVRFFALATETPRDVANRISRLFEEVKQEDDDIFDGDNEIALDPSSLYYVVGSLQKYRLLGATHNAIYEALEVFIGPALQIEGRCIG